VTTAASWAAIETFLISSCLLTVKRREEERGALRSLGGRKKTEVRGKRHEKVLLSWVLQLLAPRLQQSLTEKKTRKKAMISLKYRQRGRGE
jgi:hypothetical protein